MQPVPIDEGARGRRRIGPFWIEEGPGALLAGAAIIAIFAALFVLMVLTLLANSAVNYATGKSGRRNPL